MLIDLNVFFKIYEFYLKNNVCVMLCKQLKYLSESGRKKTIGNYYV